jgi:hypothetical protein
MKNKIISSFCTFANSKLKSMKRLFLFFVCLFSLLAVVSCNNSNPADTNNPNRLSQNLINVSASANNTANGKIPKIVFTDTNYDFGTIKSGDKVTHVFNYKNEGQGDLIIASATASCGCTIPTYSHEVKHPCDTGTISVTFDSSDKSGKVVKGITVISNSQPPYKFLTINANIQPSNN